MESDSARIVGAGIFRHRCGDQSGGRADCGQSLDGVSQTPHYSESDRRDESDCVGIARTRHRVLYINQRVGYRLLWAEQGHFNYETVGAGDGFLADLCVKWEGEARCAEDFGVRVVRLRFGMVLENDGGALAKMVLPFRLFLGGPIMPGTQWGHMDPSPGHHRLGAMGT